MNWELITSIGLELLGIAVMFGILKQKTETNDEKTKELKQDFTKSIEQMREDHRREIDAIIQRQTATDSVIQQINTTLQDLTATNKDINSKVDLILNGRIKDVN